MSLFSNLNMTEEKAKEATMAFKLTVETAPKVIKLGRSSFCALIATLMNVWCDEHDEEPFEMYIRLMAAIASMEEMLEGESDD